MAIVLWVNGTAVELGSVMFHPQEDPFPGGLTYEIRARDAGLMSFLGAIAVEGERGPLTREEVSRVFSGLEGVGNVRALDPREVERLQLQSLKYWVNTIDRMTVQGGEVHVRGIASPHVR